MAEEAVEEEEKEEEECPKCPPVGAPAWMATFADMATLLMAFFVLILSFAEFNVPKFKQISGSLKNAFGVQRVIPVVEQPKGTTILSLNFSPSPSPSVTDTMQQQTTNVEQPEVELQNKNKDDEGKAGEAEQSAEDLAKALEEAEKLYTKDKDNLRFMIAYAVTLQQTNKQEEALEIYNKILNIDKKNPEILVSKGHLQKTFGDLKGSIDSYKNSYKIDQYYGDAYWSLANLKTYQFNDEEIMQLEKMTQDEFINDNEKIYMSFALGKAFEDRGEYDKSFTNYQNGNSLKKEFTKFDLKLFDEECKNQKEVCTRDLFDSKADWGLETKEPIFVLGLPRVGSTLIEQILASHSMVEATHELPNILALSHKLNLRKVQEKTSRYPEILLSLSAPQLKMIGEQYIKDAEIFRTNKPFFIDKMPNNFRHIGLIKLILPNAKIIDIRRNSMSACFSCYKQLFAEGQEFTYDFGDLAGYYNNYVELMEHWNQVLPNQILSIKYEDLVNDFENSVNKILNYCNLDFEDECLSFYKNKRSVRTPSSEQVRQPIYRKGLDYWKNYDAYLGDLKRYLKY